MAAVLSADAVARHSRLRTATIGALAALSAVLAGLVGAGLATSGHTFALVGLAAILFPIVMWRNPDASIAMLVLIACLIDSDPLPLPGVTGFMTDETAYFTSLSEGLGVRGLLLTPLELTLGVILLVWVTRKVAQHDLRLPRSPVAVAFAVFFTIVLIAEARGLAGSADFRTSLRELRPWLYLTATYLVASQLLNRPRALWAVVWAFVLGTGIKGLQGTFLLAVEFAYSPPPFILSHEEAVFFSLYLAITGALWLYGEDRRLRWVATALLPAVLIADLANGRRTAWLILAGLGIALLAVSWIRLPQRRRLLTIVTVGFLAGCLVYFPVFWRSPSVLGQPARALRSAFAPDERDRQSTLYRHFENANLMSDIRRTTPFGQGFGIPIDYSSIPFRDLADTVTSLRFTPHNGILYIWMVTGIPGAVAFWCLMGTALVAGCRLARAPDRRLSLYGVFAVCTLIAYPMEGYYDFGLWWFRVAILVGCVLGGLEAATTLAATQAERSVRLRPEQAA
jgi:hypothetical protein